MKCPYCNAEAKLVTGVDIYPHRPDLACLNFWLCTPCDAYVGCHKGSTRPLGRLANATLRHARSRAHAAFDVLWKTKKMRRSEAYLWLANQLGLPFERTHIGEFDEPMCTRVEEVCKVFKSHNKEGSHEDRHD